LAERWPKRMNLLLILFILFKMNSKAEKCRKDLIIMQLRISNLWFRKIKMKKIALINTSIWVRKSLMASLLKENNANDL